MMSGFSSKMRVLSSYLEVVKRVLRRKPFLSYGRQPFFAKFWTDAANSIGADIDSLGDDIFRISKANNSTLVQFHYVNIDTYFNWMMVAQKPFICKLLSDHGYPIARYLEYHIRDISKARQFIDEISGNFVVKPISGAGGGGITTGISDQKKLRRASVIAAANFSQKLMIEEQYPGDSFRLLFLNGEFVDAIRRSRPTVIGDGRSSIRQLVDKENEQRRGDGPSRSLFELNADLDCEFYLHEHGKTLSSVPAAGEKTIIKNVANENSDRDNHSIRTDIHPDFMTMGKKISSLLGAKLIGIDLMAPDISVPLEQSGGIVNEINIPPGLHYHEMIANHEQKADVGARVLEFILSNPAVSITLPADSALSANSES
jgi:cyanophycin synthetase